MYIQTQFAKKLEGITNKDIAAALRNVVGGEISEYTKLLAEAREQALDRMMAEANGLGANAVVEIRFSTSVDPHCCTP